MPLFFFLNDNIVVVNRDGLLDDTVEQIEAILKAEKARVVRRCSVNDNR